MAGSPLFKYLKREHAIGLLESGVIRLGTLQEYRDVESHGQAIGDEQEGITSRYLQAPVEGMQVNLGDGSKESNFLGEVFEGDAHFSMHGLQVEVESESPNFLLLCFSKVYSPDAMQEFGYDSCVRIDDPMQFMGLIGSELIKKGLATNDGALAECDYRPRSQDFRGSDDLRPWLVKDPSYAYQREARMIWGPVPPDLNPIILQCRAIRVHCTPVNFQI